MWVSVPPPRDPLKVLSLTVFVPPAELRLGVEGGKYKAEELEGCMVGISEMEK